MKRFGRHEELTNLASFLLSEQAEYINGECVVIDGGLWLLPSLPRAVSAAIGKPTADSITISR